MPWTRKQVKYLLSDKVSPLSAQQKTKMKSELHENPKIGHMHKGYSKKTSLASLRKK